MAQFVETINSHVFAFSDYELEAIISALYEAGEDDLADEILEQIEGDETEELVRECCAESRAETIGTLKVDVDFSEVSRAIDELELMAAELERVEKARNEKDYVVRIKGDKFLNDLAEDVLRQIYEGAGKNITINRSK